MPRTAATSAVPATGIHPVSPKRMDALSGPRERPCGKTQGRPARIAADEDLRVADYATCAIPMMWLVMSRTPGRCPTVRTTSSAASCTFSSTSRTCSKARPSGPSIAQTLTLISLISLISSACVNSPSSSSPFRPDGRRRRCLRRSSRTRLRDRAPDHDRTVGRHQRRTPSRLRASYVRLAG